MDKIASLFNKVEYFAKVHHILDYNKTYIIACSGGADSLLLLNFFLAIQKKWQIKIIVAHFEHGIRGEASLHDAEFVKNFAYSKNLPFILQNADVPSWAKKHKYSLETAGRILRYRFLFQLSKKYQALIVTGHHKNDQAETILMRIVRGTGLRGVAGMSPNTNGVVRPFLSLTRKEIEKGIYLLGLEARHDTTNDLYDAFRNRIRLDLLPYITEKYNPSFLENLLHLGEIASLEADFIASEIEKIKPVVLRKEEGGISFSVQHFLNIHKALGMELLSKAVKEFLFIEREWNFSHFVRLYELFMTKNTKKLEIFPGAVRGFLCGERLYLLKKEYYREKIQTPSKMVNIALNIPSETFFPLVIQGASQKVIKVKFSVTILRERPRRLMKQEVLFDYDLLKGDFSLRTRKKGDFMQIETGHKKLKKIFMEYKIPENVRQIIPLFCLDDEVLWGYGIRQSARGRINLASKKFLLCKFTAHSIFT